VDVRRQCAREHERDRANQNRARSSLRISRSHAVFLPAPGSGPICAINPNGSRA
jgi:hypothetical protein